jgi:hypothetical protein
MRLKRLGAALMVSSALVAASGAFAKDSDQDWSGIDILVLHWSQSSNPFLEVQGTSSVLAKHNLYHAFQAGDRFVTMSHGAEAYEARKEDISVEEVTFHVIRT